MGEVPKVQPWTLEMVAQMDPKDQKQIEALYAAMIMASPKEKMDLANALQDRENELKDSNQQMAA